MEKYICLNPVCKHEFQAPVGPHQCPKCGHLYVKWITYAEAKTVQA